MQSDDLILGQDELWHALVVEIVRPIQSFMNARIVELFIVSLGKVNGLRHRVVVVRTRVHVRSVVSQQEVMRVRFAEFSGYRSL